MNKSQIQMLISTVLVLLILVDTIIGVKYKNQKQDEFPTSAEKVTSILTTTEKPTTKLETTTETTTTTKPTTTTTTTKPTTTTTTVAEVVVKFPSVSAKETTYENSKNLGQFRITCYTPYSDGGRWGYQTSTGARSTHLQTCAVDPNVIPLGSTIYINGLTLKAVDVGGAVKGNKVDIFYDGTSSEARAWLDSFGEYHTVTIL